MARSRHALLVPLILLVAAGAGAQSASDMSRFEGREYLGPELRKQVRALKGNAWDQRMARQFGQSLDMPAAEVERRLDVLESWAQAFPDSGGAPVAALDARSAAAREQLRDAKAGRGSLDPVLLFIEHVSWELEMKEKGPQAFGTLASTGATMTYSVGDLGLVRGAPVVVVPPADLRLQSSRPDAEGYVAVTVGDRALEPAGDVDLPDWIPASSALVWRTDAKLAAGERLDIEIAVPPSLVSGTTLLVDAEDKQVFVAPAPPRP